ncbi:MAG: sulfatase-like hydrolase/transferase [Clostridia bacterium]|nr:sulfatase-like hydrolase/transferase [Clostridia bacterium]
MKNRIINALKDYTNKIVNSELIIIFTGLIIFCKMLFFYSVTIYKAETIQFDIIAKTFIFSMFIITMLFILRNRLRFTFCVILNLFLSILMFADNLYYNYSTSLISVSQISNLQYSEQIANTITDLLSISQILYFVDLFVIVILMLTKIIKIEKIKQRNWKPAIIYTVIIITVFTTTIPSYVAEAQTCKYNKKMQLEKGTLYAFHYLDVQSNFNLRKTAKYSNKSDVLNAYENLKNDYDSNYDTDLYNLEGIAEGKNVILLQLESFQNFLLNKSINGKEIIPNLNKFLNENVKVNNMITQSYSTTADSEHSVISSLYPLENGMAFAQYSSNEYDDIFEIYKKSNYYNIYMHGNDGAFWNRKNVYRLLEVDEIDFIESFDSNSELINKWISDESLYRQAALKLSNAEGPFFANIVSASSHTGFDLPGLENKYEKVSIDVGKYKDTYFGNYLEAVNYADYAFGIFIDELKKADLYDDTLIFIFGDHYGVQMYNEEMLEFLQDTDHEYNNVEKEINYVNVVCGMKIPGVDKIEITKPVSKLDIKPTLSYLCGLDDGVSLGTNIFGSKDFVCLNNGIIVTDKCYYNGDWYSIVDGEKINLDMIDEGEKEKLKYYINNMEQEIAISNSIVLNNLLK